MNPIRENSCHSCLVPDPEAQLQQDENLHAVAPWFILFMACVVALFFVLTLPWWLAVRAWHWIKPNNFNHAPAMGPLSPSTSVASAAPSPAHPPGQTGLADAGGA